MKRRTRRLLYSLICVLCIVAASACAVEQDRSLALMAADIDAYATELTAEGLFSGVVLAVFKGRVVIEKGYGWADAERGAPNRPQTKFRISSLTKGFTGAAILALQEQGRLRIDDRLCRYIQPCPDAWRPVTIRHLLTHTSGIPDYVATSRFWQETVWREATVQELIDLIADLPLTGEPGARFAYSSTGYVLLGYVIAQLADPAAPANLAYLGYLDQQIFGPLGLEETGSEECGAHVEGLALGYVSPGERAASCDPSALFAMGDLYSTAPDLRRWARALDEATLLSPAAHQAMLAPQAATTHFRTAYGYGWYVTEIAGERTIWHDGASPGYRSFLQRKLGEETMVIVLANSETTPVLAMGREIAAVLIRRSKEPGGLSVWAAPGAIHNAERHLDTPRGGLLYSP